MSIYALSSYIIFLLIGVVFNTTTMNAFAIDDPFKNKVEIDTDVDNKNTCDETGEGFIQAVCAVTDNLETGRFTMLGEKNKISIDVEGENHNDERGTETMKVFVHTHQIEKSGK